MTTNEFMTIEEFNAPETTSQALINVRKYVGALLFFNRVRLIFHKIVDKMEQLNYKGTTEQAMKVAYKSVVKHVKKLNKPPKVINAYIKDIREATLGAIYGEQ